MRQLRRGISVLDVIGVRIVGRDELAKDGDEVQQDQHASRDQGHLVPAELPPHELPLRGDESSLFFRKPHNRLGFLSFSLYQDHERLDTDRKMVRYSSSFPLSIRECLYLAKQKPACWQVRIDQHAG